MSDGPSDGETTSTWPGAHMYSKQDTEVAPSKPKHYDVSPDPFEISALYDLDFLEGSALKYLLRWKKKDGIKDLRKLVDCATKLLLREQAKVPAQAKETVNT